MTTLQDRAKALAARADVDYPESWRPDRDSPNPLTGTVARFTRGTTENGDAPIMVVRDLDGKEWSCWLLHTALRMGVERLQPREGDLVFLRYDGRATSSKTGRDYHAYRVDAERDSAGSLDMPAFDKDPDRDAGDADGPSAPAAPDDIPF